MIVKNVHALLKPFSLGGDPITNTDGNGDGGNTAVTADLPR